MNYQTILGLYHFCNSWHGGQFSREYRIMCRLRFTPRGREEYLECLATAENADAREVYLHFARQALDNAEARRDAVRFPTSGYTSCVCCGHAVVVDDCQAESGVTMCDECVEHECDPHDTCEWCDEETEGCQEHTDCLECPELGVTCLESEGS